MKTIVITAIGWGVGIIIGCVISVCVCNAMKLSDANSTLVAYAVGLICGAAGAIFGMYHATKYEDKP